jgi:hypothetical protein
MNNKHIGKGNFYSKIKYFKNLLMSNFGVDHFLNLFNKKKIKDISQGFS